MFSLTCHACFSCELSTCLCECMRQGRRNIVLRKQCVFAQYAWTHPIWRPDKSHTPDNSMFFDHPPPSSLQVSALSGHQLHCCSLRNTKQIKPHAWTLCESSVLFYCQMCRHTGRGRECWDSCADAPRVSPHLFAASGCNYTHCIHKMSSLQHPSPSRFLHSQALQYLWKKRKQWNPNLYYVKPKVIQFVLP